MDYMSHLSLAKVGEMINCPKLTMDNSVAYCARDTVLVAKAYTEFVLKAFKPIYGLLCFDETGVIRFSSQANIAYNYLIYGVSGLHGLHRDLIKYVGKCYYGACVDSCMYGMAYNKPITAIDRDWETH